MEVEYPASHRPTHHAAPTETTVAAAATAVPSLNAVDQRLSSLADCIRTKELQLQSTTAEAAQIEARMATEESIRLQVLSKLSALQAEVSGIETQQLNAQIEKRASSEYEKAIEQKHALERRIVQTKRDKDSLYNAHLRLIERDNEHRQLITEYFEDTKEAKEARQVSEAIATYNFTEKMKEVMIKRQALTKVKADLRAKTRTLDELIIRYSQRSDHLQSQALKAQGDLNLWARGGELVTSSTDPHEIKLGQHLRELKQQNAQASEESRKLGLLLQTRKSKAAPAIVKRKPPPKQKVPADIDDIWE